MTSVSIQKDNRVRFPVIVEGETIAEITYNPHNPLLLRGISRITALFASDNKPGKDDFSLPEPNGDEPDEERIAEELRLLSAPMKKTEAFLDELVAAVDTICGKGMAEVIFAYDGPDMTLLKGVIQTIFSGVSKARESKTAKYKA